VIVTAFEEAMLDTQLLPAAWRAARTASTSARWIRYSLEAWTSDGGVRPTPRTASRTAASSAEGGAGPADAAYFRFAGGKPGWLRILVSRRNWGGPSDPSPVHLLIGKLLLNANLQPILGHVTKTVDLTIDSAQTKVCWLPTPSARFAAHVVVDKKFVPHDVLPQISDIRTLGAETSFAFFSERPSGTQSTCR